MAMVKHGENSASAPVMETVGAALYPRLDRKDYGLWVINMEVAMKAQEIWEAIDPETRVEDTDTGDDSITHTDSTGMKAYMAPEVHDLQRSAASQEKEVKAYMASEVHEVRRVVASQGKVRRIVASWGKEVVAERKGNAPSRRIGANACPGSRPARPETEQGASSPETGRAKGRSLT